MDNLATLGSLLGLGFVSGINLYATILTVGIATKFGWIILPPALGDLAFLTNNYILMLAAVAFTIEFVADKIPWVDTIWDSFHTLIRPVGAGIIAMKGIVAIDPVTELIVMLLCGGMAFASHSTKASVRVAANHSPEPFSNIALSLTEDVGAISIALLAFKYPVTTLIILSIFIVIFCYLAPKIYRQLSVLITASLACIRNVTGSADASPNIPSGYHDLLPIEKIRNKLSACIKCATGKNVVIGKNHIGYIFNDNNKLYFSSKKMFRTRGTSYDLNKVSDLKVDSKLLIDKLSFQYGSDRKNFTLFKGSYDDNSLKLLTSMPSESATTLTDIPVTNKGRKNIETEVTDSVGDNRDSSPVSDKYKYMFIIGSILSIISFTLRDPNAVGSAEIIYYVAILLPTMWACYSLAKWKGYPASWSLLGFTAFIGIWVLGMFPSKTGRGTVKQTLLILSILSFVQFVGLAGAGYFRGEIDISDKPQFKGKINEAPVPVSTISPSGELEQMFYEGSIYTDQQRQDKIKELRGTDVAWILPVQSVLKKEEYFRIQTQEGLPVGSSHPGRVVGTVLYIKPISSEEGNKYENIKAGYIVSFEGKIDGVEERRIVIRPASIKQIIVADSLIHTEQTKTDVNLQKSAQETNPNIGSQDKINTEIGIQSDNIRHAQLFKKYNQVDEEMTLEYKSVMSKLSTGGKSSLKKEQIAWIKRKESQCDAESNDTKRLQCQVGMTEERLSQLRLYK